jgi:hypothetical protein
MTKARDCNNADTDWEELLRELEGPDDRCVWSGNKASLKDGSFLVRVGTEEGKGCKRDDVVFVAWVQGAESSLCALHIKKLHIITRVGADGRAIDVKVAVGLLTELDAEVPCGSSTFAEGPVDEGTRHTVREWPSVLKPKPGVRGRPYMYSVMLNRILCPLLVCKSREGRHNAYITCQTTSRHG